MHNRDHVERIRTSVEILKPCLRIHREFREAEGRLQKDEFPRLIPTQITVLRSLQGETKATSPLLRRSSPIPPELVAGKEALQHLIVVVQPADRP